MKFVFGFVGSGAGANFLIDNIIKNKELFKRSIIHIYEKYPYPFGLIRTGIAPDHQKAKILIKKFSENIIQNNKQIEYFGNCNINNILTLKNHYSAIILSNGAQRDNLLNIPGEKLKYVYSSRNISNWYNCGIDSKKIEINKFNNNLVIIGNGNVSLDIARILGIRSINELDKLDINRKRLAEINSIKKGIKNILIVARRGIEHSAFSTKQIRAFCALGKKNNWSINIDEKELKSVSTINHLQREVKRKIDVIKKNTNITKIDYSNFSHYLEKTKNNIFFLYNYKPIKIEFGENTKTNSIIFIKNEKNGKRQLKINTGLIIKSIGVNNGNISPNYFQIPGIYKVGWASTNGKGQINKTLQNSLSAYTKLLNDIKNGTIKSKPSINREYIKKTILKSNKSQKILSFEDWLKIDQYEREMGKLLGKEREKLLTKEEMLELI